MNDDAEGRGARVAGGFTAVAAGKDHSLALKRNGTVIAWGSNTYGECDIPAGLSGLPFFERSH